MIWYITPTGIIYHEADSAYIDIEKMPKKYNKIFQTTLIIYNLEMHIK